MNQTEAFQLLCSDTIHFRFIDESYMCIDDDLAARTVVVDV